MNGHPRLAGRYRLLSPLGEGGLGPVWLAADDLLRRDVAVNEVRLAPGIPAAERTRLCEATVREVRFAAALRHPSIETVHEVVVEDGHPWLVTDLPSGRTLEQAVTERHPLPPSQVARIGSHLVAALDVAHGAGIVHGDVQPGTILLTKAGRAVLTRFGLAAAFERPGIGRAADLWSLAATLHFGVEGRPPEPGNPPAGPLGTVLDAMLQPDASARPPMGVVAAAFDDLAHGRPASLTAPAAERGHAPLLSGASLRRAFKRRRATPQTPAGAPQVPDLLNEPPEPLDRILSQGGPLEPERAAVIGLAVLDRLVALHAQGRHHGDVRPGSIMVDPVGVASLADPVMPTGISSYTAPEGSTGPAADLWSLGATLFAAVEGVSPSPGAPITRAGTLAPVLFRLLSGDPAQRPTPDALRRDLESVAATPRSYRSRHRSS